MMSQLGSYKESPPSIPQHDDSVLHRLGTSADHDNQRYQNKIKRVRFEDSQQGHLSRDPVEARPSEEDGYLLLIITPKYNLKINIEKPAIIKLQNQINQGNIFGFPAALSYEKRISYQKKVQLISKSSFKKITGQLNKPNKFQIIE
ncbi:unnamed protein product [Paramecium pentaurelia]|uniref:Uncharacterized protein n=1 Tax=Paramecium pentaurelia TaxID=43138 RepID=A0A8S1TRR1_9CILI|nr:unnamed protein product [Paramecium pentaurelia]